MRKFMIFFIISIVYILQINSNTVCAYTYNNEEFHLSITLPDSFSVITDDSVHNKQDLDYLLIESIQDMMKDENFIFVAITDDLQHEVDFAFGDIEESVVKSFNNSSDTEILKVGEYVIDEMMTIGTIPKVNNISETKVYESENIRFLYYDFKNANNQNVIMYLTVYNDRLFVVTLHGFLQSNEFSANEIVNSIRFLSDDNSSPYSTEAGKMVSNILKSSDQNSYWVIFGFLILGVIVFITIKKKK